MPAPTLVIMAAGSGSRFGSPKQLHPVGPRGHTLMEYTAYDAIRAGVERLVVVVQSGSKERVRQLLSVGVADVADVILVEQDTHRTLSAVANRAKPWGTGHAVATVVGLVEGPFIVVNADDLYGANSIGAVVESLSRIPSVGALIGYRLERTLSQSGAVKRGICRVNGEGFLQQITEYVELAHDAGAILGIDRNGRRKALDPAQLTSMNIWGFPASVAYAVEETWFAFAEAFGADSEREFYLPDVINELIESRRLQCKVLETDDAWCGLTHHDDSVQVRRQLAHLTRCGVYPSDLWDWSSTD